MKKKKETFFFCVEIVFAKYKIIKKTKTLLLLDHLHRLRRFADPYLHTKMHIFYSLKFNEELKTHYTQKSLLCQYDALPEEMFLPL